MVDGSGSSRRQSRPSSASGIAVLYGAMCHLRRPCWRDRRLRWSSARSPAVLATDPVERVVVVMKDGAAREAAFTTLVFDQLARIAAGWKATVVAVLRDEH